MTKRREGPELDPKEIEFPGDRITIGQMRRADAQLFEGDTLNSVHAIDIGALATSSWEHRLAEKAFKRALGAPDPYPRTTRGEIVDMLSRDYATYGLSRGRNESAELIRRIESAAERQAQKRGRDAGRE